jgi:hypothetical protein
LTEILAGRRPRRNAIEIAWLPTAARDQLLAEIEQYAGET